MDRWQGTQLFSDFDEKQMRRALALAERGLGRVEPNPMVGCVLVRQGRVVGEGYHRKFGKAHAEVEALKSAGSRAVGATAYVTLEPCSHYGKTPPCCRALIDARVSRVVVAHLDPFPEVAGKGCRELRRAGIDVNQGLLAADAAELNAPFLTRILQRRPYVIAKWAQSIDGKIATRLGDSRWISCDQSRRIVHQLRARVDAVVVGVGTVLADDPMLDARDVRIKRHAARVIFDSHLRVPLRAKLVSTATQLPTLIMTTSSALDAESRKARRLEKAGLILLPCRAAAERVSLKAALAQLARRGMTNILVEGGGALIGSFRDRKLLDEAYVFTAPILIGGQHAITGCEGGGCSTVKTSLRAVSVNRRTIGSDLLTRIRFSDPPTIDIPA